MEELLLVVRFLASFSVVTTKRCFSGYTSASASKMSALPSDTSSAFAGRSRNNDAR